MLKNAEQPTRMAVLLNIPKEGSTRHSDPFVLLCTAIFSLYIGYDGVSTNIQRRASLISSSSFFKCPESNVPECKDNQSRLERLESLQWMRYLPFLFALLVIGRLLYVFHHKRQNVLHPHHQMVVDFVKNNPTYPTNRESVEIHCPMSMENTKEPICISYTHGTKHCASAYDYQQLIKWFKEDGGLCDPATNIHLLGDDVSNFKISFDIPQAVIDKCPPEFDNDDVDNPTLHKVNQSTGFHPN